jgi:hypothetical protein
MVRKKVFDFVGYFDEKMHRFEDTDMWSLGSTSINYSIYSHKSAAASVARSLISSKYLHRFSALNILGAFKKRVLIYSYFFFFLKGVDSKTEYCPVYFTQLASKLHVLQKGTIHRTRELYINLGNWACAAALVRACRGKTKGDLSTCPAWLDLLDHQPVVAGIATIPYGFPTAVPRAPA